MDVLKSLEHKFKAVVFNLLKLFLSHGQKDCIPIDGNKIETVLFLRPDKLGDMIISFPVFDALKKHYPHIKISILGSPRSKMIIENDNRFFKKYMYNKRPLQDIKTIIEIRKEKYDCVIDMVREDSVTSLFLSQLTVSRKPRIGLAKTKYDLYYDYNEPFKPNNKIHIIDNTLKALKAFGIDSEKESGYAELYLTDKKLEFAYNFIQTLKVSDKTKIIGYNLSAGAPNRVWQEDKSIKLLSKIRELSRDYKILLFTTPKERDRAITLVNVIQSGVEIIPENLNLTSVAALIKHLDLLITPDTSLVHIARSFHIPVVGLYSNFMKNYMLWRPYEQEIGSVISANDDNIYDITVEQVIDTFKSVTEHGKMIS